MVGSQRAVGAFPLSAAATALFADFAKTCEAVAATTKRNEKLAVLADYLRRVPDDSLAIAATYCAGTASTPGSGQLKVGGSLAIAAAQALYGCGDQALHAAYDRHGDLGSALADLAAAASKETSSSDRLTIKRVDAVFREMSQASGAGASRKRMQLLASLFADASAVELKYIVKLVTGDFRIGLRQALAVDAIAAAFGAEPASVRRALQGVADIGRVAQLARAGDLEKAMVAYGTPIGFMLASPIRFGGSYKEVAGGEYLIEDKFDGIRAQAHVFDGQVRLFSRRMNDITETYDDVAGALRASNTARAIFDGELLAYEQGRALPFLMFQGRLQAKPPADGEKAGVPLAFVAFDMLAEGDEFLIDRPLDERRARLERWGETLPDAVRDRLVVTASQTLSAAQTGANPSPPGDRGATIERLYTQARERGNEGLMLKALDSPYQPGRRGRLWFKLKRELATLDCVVVAVEYGHGRRNKVLSDYTFAVRDDGRLLTIGKAYSGLTDAEIAEMSEWFFAHTIERRGRRLIVEPEIVVEIAFDVLQPSTLHESGYAMRFPRIVRLRPDKRASDASTLEEAAALASA